MKRAIIYSDKNHPPPPKKNIIYTGAALFDYKGMYNYETF